MSPGPMRGREKSAISSDIREQVVQVSGKGWGYDLYAPNQDTDYIQRSIAQSQKPYESDMLADMASRLEPDSMVLDVGANIGNHTIYLAVVARCRVQAFEPNRQLCEALNVSVSLNGLETRVQVNPVAVGRKAARGAFERFDPKNLGAQSVSISSDMGDFEVIALDESFGGQCVDAIKIDVEGMELEVLEGAAKIIDESRPLLYIECQDENAFRRIGNWLYSRGYRYAETFNVTPTHLFSFDCSPSLLERLDQALFREVIGHYRFARENQSLRDQLHQARVKYGRANEQVARFKGELAEASAQAKKARLDTERSQELLAQAQAVLKEAVAAATRSEERFAALTREIKAVRRDFAERMLPKSEPHDLAQEVAAVHLLFESACGAYARARATMLDAQLARLRTRRALRFTEAIRLLPKHPLAAIRVARKETGNRQSVPADGSEVIGHPFLEADSVGIPANGGRALVRLNGLFPKVEVWIDDVVPEHHLVRPAVFLNLDGDAGVANAPESWRKNRNGRLYRYLPPRGGVLSVDLPVNRPLELEVRASRSSFALPDQFVLHIRPASTHQLRGNRPIRKGKDGGAKSSSVNAMVSDRAVAARRSSAGEASADTSGGDSNSHNHAEYRVVPVEWAVPTVFEISADRVYRLNLPYVACARNPQASVLALTFMDTAEKPIEATTADLSHSPKYGAYRYVAVDAGEGNFAFTFRPPTGASRVRVALYAWKERTVGYQVPSIVDHCALPEVQEQESIRLIEHLLEDWRRSTSPLVVLSTTTKPVGERHRANRPMQFALEYADSGAKVIYVYYRYSEREPLPARDHTDNLLQIPNDHFHRFATQIAFAEGISNKYLLSSIPDYHSVYECGLFKSTGWRVVYEARDDWEEFQNEGIGRWYDPLFERYLCLHADMVAAVSSPLIKKMQTFGAPPEKCYVIPNGAAAAFVKAGPAEREARRDGRRGSKIGYFGHLTGRWFDWRLIDAAAKARPAYQFEIIGFDAPTEIELPSNVALFDSMDHNQLIERARDWEVGLVPFKRSILASAVDPIKAHEYLALGLKVVASKMPQMEDYPATITYGTADHFVAALDRAMTWTLEDRDWEGIENHVAEANWRGRAQRTLALADALIP